MAEFEMHFTVDEARSALPELRQEFAHIHSLISEMVGLHEAYANVQALIRANGHAPKESGFEPRVHQLQLLLQAIVDRGILVKDVERGLVDFPHWRDGEEVLLCWELSEDDIRFWHGVEDGYAGRQAL